jgi:uncharacterized SAM-binding protein YcdF (DUF218 family)
MDTLFFWASKIIWALISPDNLLLFLFVLATLLLSTRWRDWGHRLLIICCTGLAIIALLPVGEWLIYPLENRFPAQPTLPAHVDGIIMLGGTINGASSIAWGQIDTNEAADRIHAFAELASRYPQAKLVFTGGSGSISKQDISEADFIPALAATLGIASDRLLIESTSRNTWENALNSKQKFAVSRDENWVLITSAFHMARSSSAFCAQNWPVIPWPVDHRSERGNLFRIELKLAQHFSLLTTATREWVGLLAYRLTGKSAQFLTVKTTSCRFS